MYSRRRHRARMVQYGWQAATYIAMNEHEHKIESTTCRDINYFVPFAEQQDQTAITTVTRRPALLCINSIPAQMNCART